MCLPQVARMALRPVITVCGPTGVGKSKLGVALAHKLSEKFNNHGWKGGVVINADVMQVYKGFPIITNKMTMQEREGVEHLLMDFKEPTDPYVVGQWINDATRAIDDAHNSNKVPIVVGGTTYWIQHLIYPGRLATEPEQVSGRAASQSWGGVPLSDELSSGLSRVTSDLRELFYALPEAAPLAADNPDAALALYNLLQALDPSVAARWHWRDTRKVLRNLEIMKESGKKVSEMIQEQSAIPLKPRYDTLAFWLYAEPEEQKRRLNARADEMLQNGLLDEVREMSNPEYQPKKDGSDTAAASPIDLTTVGVFQSIGFREFHEYLNDPAPSEIKYQAANDKMKLGNLQYARRQILWVRNKLLPAIRESNSAEVARRVQMYLLDTTDRQNWTSQVGDVAKKLMGAFLAGDPLPDPLTLSPAAQKMLTIPPKATDPAAVLLARKKVTCPVCTVEEKYPVMIEVGPEWEAHVGSKVHKRLAAKQAKGERQQQQQQQQQQHVRALAAASGRG